MSTPHERRHPFDVTRFSSGVGPWMTRGTVLAYGWLAVGRPLVSGGGWVTVMLVVGAPVLLGALLLPALGLRWRRRRGGADLTTAEAAAQIAVWAGLAVAGLTTVDFGDSPDSTNSILGTMPYVTDDLTVLITISRVVLALTTAAWLSQLLLAPMAVHRRHRMERCGVGNVAP